MSSFEPVTLTDDALIERLKALACDSNVIEASLIAHLAEVDARDLHLARAYPSLFAYCTGELGFSEAMAFNRILVARTSRRFPLILERLRDGAVHLSGLRILAPHLTPENHVELLRLASKKSKRDIEGLIAARFPKPAVPDAIRKLPEARPIAPAIPPAAHVATAQVSSSPLSPPAFALTATQVAPRGAPKCHEPVLPRPLPPRADVAKPLSATQFKVQFTADQALSDKLREAQDLLRHQVPDGSLAEIVERALDLLILEVKKERFGVGRVPRKVQPEETKPGSRHIPAAIKRQVYERDGGRCSFTDERGQRCQERGWLELDHVRGFARDPTHSADGLRLLCRAHNAFEASRMYGTAFMEAKRWSSSPPTRTEIAPLPPSRAHFALEPPG